ncbi:apolipoprotein N-acyltransferase [Crossiella equi]|uniref:Apolipoprotein N-acyltransferase n=2 Tax=Crossiella equi TaxID=130796 RepID=A0ABS5ALG2_9PSEU|nr:hypothetical protein [Crossiella equi]MBP2477261.1 apolipoprotein N-acyltransferase [Crossiella equi]
MDKQALVDNPPFLPRPRLPAFRITAAWACVLTGMVVQPMLSTWVWYLSLPLLCGVWLAVVIGTAAVLPRRLALTLLPGAVAGCLVLVAAVPRTPWSPLRGQTVFVANHGLLTGIARAARAGELGTVAGWPRNGAELFLPDAGMPATGRVRVVGVDGAGAPALFLPAVVAAPGTGDFGWAHVSVGNLANIHADGSGRAVRPVQALGGGVVVG